MTELYIDCGNTNIVYGLGRRPSVDDPMAPDALEKVWRCATDGNRCADEYWSFLLSMLDEHAQCHRHITWQELVASIERIFISSVVPEVTEKMVDMAAKNFSCEAIVVGLEHIQPLLHVDLERAHEVGSDRLLNTLAAKLTVEKSCVVVDFGTATTFDILDQKGAYAGGLICPGLSMMRDSLKQKTALLPSITLARPSRVIGKNTTEAMNSGIIFGYVSMIEGLIAKINSECKITHVLSTGGFCDMFARLTPTIHRSEPLLVMKALAAVSAYSDPVIQ